MPTVARAATTTVITLVRGWRRLGHEVKVEKLHRLELHIAGGGAGFENGRDGEQAVEVLKDARVGRGLEQSNDEDE